MPLHHVECSDDACGHIFEALVPNQEPGIPPCPRCQWARVRHNGVRRFVYRSSGRIEIVDAKCTNDERCGQVETGVETPDEHRIPQLPFCEKCGKSTQIVVLPPQVTWRADPVVVFKAADGTYRFPGDANGVSARSYEKQGLERVELRNFADVRRFERTINQQERSKMARSVEAKHRGRQMQEADSRGHLLSAMKSFSNMGRDVARESIRIGNNRPQPKTHDPGFRVEAYSDDRSSREVSRDAQGRRRRD